MELDPPYDVRNIFSEVEEKFVYRIYVTELGDFKERHLDALDLIRSVGEEDEVHLYITSPGGLVDVADMYTAAISQCKGKVITHGVGTVASAAVMIFLEGDERIAEPGSAFMIHNPRLGWDGDIALVSKGVEFYKTLFQEKYYPLYSQVLTSAEMGELFERSGEVFLTADEMNKRLKGEKKKSPPPVVAGTVKSGEWLGAIPNHATYGGSAEAEIWRGIVNNPLSLEPVVALPFPKTKVKSAEEFPSGDEFTITLDEGYRKVFKLGSLCEKDFDEYNLEEIYEIGEVFDVILTGLTRSQAIEEIIEEAQGRGNE